MSIKSAGEFSMLRSISMANKFIPIPPNGRNFVGGDSKDFMYQGFRQPGRTFQSEKKTTIAAISPRSRSALQLPETASESRSSRSQIMVSSEIVAQTLLEGHLCFVNSAIGAERNAGTTRVWQLSGKCRKSYARRELI
jgi:hypothetical protein